jgi:hypothetical protein
MRSKQTTVRVTAGHIAHGEVRACHKCPIALAVLDALGNPAGALAGVGMDGIEVTMPGEFRLADTPSVARDFIEDFDFLGDVSPIEFTLTWLVMETETRP